MTRADYKFADVSNVVLTGQTLPDREAAGVFAPPKHEDLAFLTEACWERGIAYSLVNTGGTARYVPQVPSVMTLFYMFGWATQVYESGEDLIVGYSAYVAAPNSLALRWLTTDAAIPTVFPALSSSAFGSNVVESLFSVDPTFFIRRFQFSPQFANDSIPYPTSGDMIIRRLFYTLKNQRRFIGYAETISSDIGWRALRHSGTAYYHYTSTWDGQTDKDYGGSASYVDKDSNATIDVPCTGTQTSIQSVQVLTSVYRVVANYRVTPDSIVETDHTVEYVVLSALTFKTKTAYKSVSQFFLIQIVAGRYARRDADVSTSASETAWYFRRCACSLVRTITDDPDGWVQEWRVSDMPEITAPILASFAVSNGFHIPSETAATRGSLAVSVLGYNVVDCEPAFRTEIDPHDAWGWTP